VTKVSISHKINRISV